MRTAPFLFALLFTAFTAVTCLAQAQTGWSDKSRIMPDKLRGIPVGLTLWHTNNPCVPEKDGDSYVWKHSTMIRAEVGDLAFVEVGSFIWYDATGWHPNMQENAQDFAENFGSADGKLKQGRPFTFAKNWRYGKQLYGGDALWYVLARDKAGKLYKGYGIIETEAKTAN